MSSTGPFSLVQVIYDTWRMSVHDVISSMLPLNERGVLNKSKLVPEVYKLRIGQRLCKNISNLLISRNIMELHGSLLHHVMNEVVLDLNEL